MSMNYGVIWPSFWTGNTGRQLKFDADGRLVATYLMTSPHANIIGVYHCPIQHMAYEIGWPIEGASKGLLKLIDIGFCTFDEATDTVWVHEMAFYQIGDRLKPLDKRVKHVHRFFDGIVNNHIKRAFFEKYGAAYLIPEPLDLPAKTSPIEGASKPLQSPIGGGSDTITVTSTITGTSVPTERTPTASPDPDKELFDRGKQVLGKSAGGQIVKLKAAKGGNIALARAAIEQASQKQNPGEYIAGVIRGGGSNHPPQFQERQTNGYVTRLLKREQVGHAADREPIDITPDRPSGPGGLEGRKE
jgi:hypothetical protein